MKEYKILFVCLGNICRSPLAHAIFQEMVKKEGLPIVIESCGTGAYHVGELADKRMRETAAKHSIKMTHRARAFKESDLIDYDKIIPMDESNYLFLVQKAKTEEQQGKIAKLREWDPQGSGDVPDPYYGGAKGFDHVFDIVKRSCEGLLEDFKQM